MRTVFVLVEEESARPVVESVWQAMKSNFPNDSLTVKVHQGKQDLQKAIPKVVPALSRVPDARILILHDQDSADCVELKMKLVSLIRGSVVPFKVCIVCRELESWFLGDFNALSLSFPRFDPILHRNSRRYRRTDAIVNPLNELRRLVPELGQMDVSKVTLSRTVSVHLNLNLNTNHSFNHFLSAIQNLLA